MQKMDKKFLIFSIIASFVITKTYGQSKLRGVREYSPELPATGVDTIVLNETSRPITLDQIIPQNFATNSNQDSEDSSNQWEPLACTQCLNERYLAHYKVKGCKAVEGDLICRKSCPKYFQCPKKQSNQKIEGCEYNGKIYRFGEDVPLKNPCRKACFCSPNTDVKNITHPEITCADVDCFNNFRAPTPNCFTVWDEDKCCGREKCLTPQQMLNEFKCLYDGRHYRLGEKIYPKEDPCLICKCDRNWNPNKTLNGIGCKKHDCDLQSNRNFKAGCLPIYHEQTCCPIEYFCPPPEEHQCKFNGKKYLIGERLEIPIEGTECKCKIPPELTCIKRAINETKLKITKPENYIKDFQTLPTIDITNSSNNPFKDLPDLTKDSKCAPYVEGGLTCAGVNCTTILDKDGCQACKCEIPCARIKCRARCTLVATTPGLCPQCKCD